MDSFDDSKDNNKNDGVRAPTPAYKIGLSLLFIGNDAKNWEICDEPHCYWNSTKFHWELEKASRMKDNSLTEQWIFFFPLIEL